jgi:hypothetical protein
LGDFKKPLISRQRRDGSIPHPMSYASSTARKIRALECICKGRNFVLRKHFGNGVESVIGYMLLERHRSLPSPDRRQGLFSHFALTPVHCSAIILKICL